MPRIKKPLQFTVMIESCEEGGYFAFCPSFQGCHVQGESIKETLRELKAAIRAFIAEYVICGLRVPGKDGLNLPKGKIDVTALKAVTARESDRILLKVMFAFARQSGGSHAVYRRDADRRRTCVPIHAGKTLKRKTLKAILQDAGITVDDFVRLWENA
jgi:predicted RNA binding protein YcfA (HicA-like mRNA interferase family)/predicted RNase H-like HicB family nuclease